MSQSHRIKGEIFRSSVFFGSEGFLSVRSNNSTPLTYIILDIPNYEILHRKAELHCMEQKVRPNEPFQEHMSNVIIVIEEMHEPVTH